MNGDPYQYQNEEEDEREIFFEPFSHLKDLVAIII